MNQLVNSKFVRNLKAAAEENPVVVILATAALLTSVAKVVDARAHSAGSRAYAKQIDRKYR